MRYASLILLCLVGFCSMAQMPNWKVKAIDLPPNVSNLTIDTLGFLWMSSKGKMYRFNGADLDLKFSFEDEKIVSIREQKGIFYIGTAYGRLLEVNPYRFTFKVMYEGDEYRPITDVYVVDDRNFILLSYGFGIQISMDGKVSHLTTEKGLLSNEVYEIEAFNGKIYVTSDQGIQVVTLQDNDFLLSRVEEKDGISELVTTQLLNAGDQLWYSDYDSHIGSIDLEGKITIYPLPFQGRIKDLVKHRNLIYVLNEAGIQCFGNGEWELKYSKKANAGIDLLHPDEEDNLWIVDHKNNLSIGNLRFQKIDLDLKEIRAVASVGEHLFVGNEEGLYHYADHILTQVNTRNITCLKKYNDYLLVGTFSNGIMIYDDKGRLIDKLESWSNIPNESILSIYGHEDYIYVSSLSGVVKMQVINNRLKPIQSLNTIIGQTYVYSILAKGESMYFGTDRNGLVKWNSQTDQIEILDRFDNGDKIGSVYALTIDEASKIWFTSAEKGIGKINTFGIDYLKNVQNVKDEFTSIENLRDGSLLLIRSGSLGLLQTKDNHLMYFDEELGFKDETAFLNTTTQELDRTYFVNGNSIYMYSAMDSIKIHPEIIIDEVIVNLTSVKNQTVFDENENNIAIKFKGSWLTDPYKLSYQYKLDGFDNTWRETKDDQVAFPKLVPGKYKFTVRAAENGIFSNEPEASFSFEIKRHFINFWYVRLFLACIVLLIVLTWWKAVENQKKEKQALEKTIVENQLLNLKNQLNPHFLFNSFNTLIALIEEDSERSISFVERMTLFYRSMLELGKEGLVNLEKEKMMLEQYIGILEERFQNQLMISAEFEDAGNYEIPPMTLQLLVENAVKHNVVSSKDPLQLKIHQKGENLSIWNKRNKLVSNSVGTNTGLKNIKKRFELANLPIPIINATEEYFEVKLKLKRI